MPTIPRISANNQNFYEIYQINFSSKSVQIVKHFFPTINTFFSFNLIRLDHLVSIRGLIDFNKTLYFNILDKS